MLAIRLTCFRTSASAHSFPDDSAADKQLPSSTILAFPGASFDIGDKQEYAWVVFHCALVRGVPVARYRSSAIWSCESTISFAALL